MATVPTTISEQGQLVAVRQRQYVVTDDALRARLRAITEEIGRETAVVG